MERTKSKHAGSDKFIGERTLSGASEPTSEEMGVLRALYNQGRFAESEALAHSLVSRFPHYSPGWQAFGSIFKQRGKIADAVIALQKAVELSPRNEEVHNNLGLLFKGQGRLAEAKECYLRALEINPRYALVHNNLGNIQREQGDFAEAIASYRNAIEACSDFAEAYNNLGVVFKILERLGEAEFCYRQAIKIKPAYFEAQWNFAILLDERDALVDAERSYKQTLNLKPDFIEAYFRLADVFRRQERLEDAEASYKTVLQFKPDSARAHNKLGSIYIEQGRLDEARHCFKLAMAADPASIIPHCNISSLKTYTEGDPDVDFLERQLHQIMALPETARSSYWFALGKMREDLGRYDDSFTAYAEGNRIQRMLYPFDNAAADLFLEKLLSIFTEKFFASHSRSLKYRTERTPIFIIGMPRSGTTLLEQVLSSCQGVYGAGELTDLQEIVMSNVPNGTAAQFQRLSAEDFRRMGEDYIERVWRRAPAAKYIVDKLPSNFFFAGMIHLMIPNAKIIHSARDPMDSCFSCYARLFETNAMNFSYDLEALGRYCVRYIKLMRHWHTLLPSDAILTVNYEDMVVDTEGEARRILNYLGLPWDEDCLAFYRNKRVIRTASTAQVRQPIYKTSLARWERFGKHLSPLLDILREYRDTKPDTQKQ